MNRIKKIFHLFIFSLYFVLPVAFSSNLSTHPFAPDELTSIKTNLFNNIATKQHILIKKDKNSVIYSLSGAVLASPSNHEKTFSQDYQFHWVRDAAITMNEIAMLYSEANDVEKKQLRPYLLNYIAFENKAQNQISTSGEKTLGQPKYNLDATIWEGKWARPQNDGPALRAITMMSILSIFQHENHEYPRQTLLHLIENDLDYIVDEWHHPTFDLWEEIKDRDHFFTKLVQRKALLDGADLMKLLGNKQQENRYSQVAKQISQSLQKHWNNNLGYYSANLTHHDDKGRGMNSAILLGVLYGYRGDPQDLFSPNNDAILSSIYFMRNAFSGLYKIDVNHPIPMIGRYPTDIYDGNQFLYGNPWILTTNALAHYYYLLANIYLKQGQISITNDNILFFRQLNPQLTLRKGTILLTDNHDQFYEIINSLVNEGDRILTIVKTYSICYTDKSCYHFSEQIDRASGKPVSAKDLTWGYTTLLSAMRVRSSLG